MTMNNFLGRLSRWLSDPLGRHQILDRHDEIISEIYLARRESRRVIRQHEFQHSFPISGTIGNPRLRGRRTYATDNR